MRKPNEHLLEDTERSTQELLNGLRGGEHGTDKEYSSDPGYEEVDSTLFEYLDQEY